MVTIKTIKGVVSGGVVLAAAVFAGGCGGGNSAPALTQQQALAVTSDLFVAMASAPLAPGGIAQAVNGPKVGAMIRGAKLNDGAGGGVEVAPQVVVPALTPVTVVIPAFTYNCPSGGTIGVTGSFTGTDNEATTPPTINVTESIVETPHQCNERQLIINGNPNVTITANVALAGNVFTDLTTIAGGLTIGGNNCSINVTVSAVVNDQTGTESGTISGSVCGVSVNGTL